MAKASDLLARIDERQQALENKFETHQDFTKQMYVNLDNKIQLVLDQTIKTNGRVTHIEDERLPSLEHWRMKLKGVWLTITIVAVAINAVVLIWIAFVK